MNKFLIVLGIVAIVAIAFLNPLIAAAAALGGGGLVMYKRK